MRSDRNSACRKNRERRWWYAVQLLLLLSTNARVVLKWKFDATLTNAPRILREVAATYFDLPYASIFNLSIAPQTKSIDLTYSRTRENIKLSLHNLVFADRR